MIQRVELLDGPGARSPHRDEIAFAALWTTGPDPRRDRVFKMTAERRRNGRWETFEVACRPFSESSASDKVAGATRRMAREYGVQGPELADARSPEEAWPELVAFLDGVPTVVLDRADFEARAMALGGGVPVDVVGVLELAEVFAPGRLSSMGEDLIDQVVPGGSRPKRAVGPRELRAAAGAIVGAFLELEPAVVALVTHGYRAAAAALADVEPDAAHTLSRCLELAARPRAWSDGGDELFPAHAGLREGVLAQALHEFPQLVSALGSVQPLWTTPEREPRSISPDTADAVVLSDEDAKRIDEIFEHHLPQMFGGSYRKGQHEVAREVGKSLGTGELLLVHAPTGTGKTLAYLVPVAMWAARNEVRTGVATFTRALQEQAMDREVPLALELLRRSGFPLPSAISVLKGRQNYLCWRALELQAPPAPDTSQAAEPGEEGGADSGERLFAWTRTALFAATDPDGDLDRLPRRTELPFGSTDGRRRVERETRQLLRRARAESGCCRIQRDRATCGAEAARRRAERSHVVITNHSLALARQGFFRVAIFDECEHLHDQAHAAWSHVLALPRLRDLLSGLSRSSESPGARPRALDRVRRAALRGSAARACADRCVELRDASRESLAHVERAVGEFKGWREALRGERDQRDEHSLFREYATSERATGLLEAHALLVAAWNELISELAALSEHLDHVPVRGRRRLRRTLDLARSELEDFLLGISAWIPRDADGPSFRPETFYDIETDDRGRDALAARVLLPHEYLGRYYFPELQGAVCISATTHLGGSFEASATYLGLQRAANPAPDEDREPRALRTFYAPSPFDYGRVLVAVPRDAPPFQSRTKQAFLDYTCRFVRELGERTRGRMLVLFTNAADCAACGRQLEPFFAERGIPFWYQRMEGIDKEELAELFRSRTDSILFGLDTFWYGADFPGETLEYLVIVKLPYGVPDRYHHAQCASLGASEQRRRIYMPRALAKFRQGFGRLMRKETDRGCVFALDGRVLDPRHRAYLKELPIAIGASSVGEEGLARFVRGDTERVMHEALAHMGMLTDVRRHEAEREERGASEEDSGGAGRACESPPTYELPQASPRREQEYEGPREIQEEDIPF